MRCSAFALCVAIVLAPLPAALRAQEAAATPTELETAIGKQLDKFVAAFDAAEAAKAAESFMPDAEWTDESGIVHKGREEIALLLGAFFENFKGAKMLFDVEAVRPLGANLATAELIRTVTVGDAAKNHALTRSTVCFAKEGDQWLLATAIDDPAEDELTPHEHLQDVAWLIGEWVDEGSDSVIEIKTEWSEDQNYILANYKIVREGETVMNSQQRIGWDPLEGKIHSWLFDSDGGFGQGVWTKIGDRWVVKSQAVMPDGTTGSATFIFITEGEDRFAIQALDRVVGDEVVEDTEMTIVRKPAQK